MNRFLHHAIKTIKAATIKIDPFDHIYMSDFFPPDLYKELLAQLPDKKFYQNLGPRDTRLDGTSTRDVFNILNPGLRHNAGIDETSLWHEVAEGLSSNMIAVALFEKFALALAARFGISANAAGSLAYEILELRLLRDTVDYKLLPHTDSSKKLITLQAYLASPGDDPRLGTSLYEMSMDGPLQSFVEVTRLEFLPNSAYAFAISANSWHGREKLVQRVERNTLILNVSRW
jgi:hypothetical protein